MSILDLKLPIAIERVVAPGITPGLWVDLLGPFMLAAGITTQKRIAAFVAQVAVESNGLSCLEEDLAYSPKRLMEVWPSHFTDEMQARMCGFHPESIANAVYCNRMGNGDIASGDGWKFRGAGLIQLTGRENQTRFATAARISVDTVGAYLRTPRGAAQGATWFWTSRGFSLNTLADGWFITSISRHVNGGDEGLEHRIILSNEILKAIGG